ncbi:Alpha/beta-hydrolase [Pleurostoma richardsiae]|uniref:Alpha/beta-hydrolase n=1 Tax=Pleurostoma richardsiae TaxID=41990 RepID=A0AA38VQN6_9PEZI|nr:Alpha/beta-hydrolase [Pleurostoma richardsiae]
MAPQLEGYLTVSAKPDIRIYYSVDGPLDGSRPTIVLSNSLAATTHLWDGLTSYFGPTHTIIRYDSRFHGKSPLSADADFNYAAGHSLDNLADDLILLLDHLGISRASLAVGLSIGAGVVLIAGAKHPSRLGHVLVVGTKAQPPAGADAAYDSRIAYGREHGSQSLGRQSVGRWFPEAWIKANPERAVAVEEIVGGQSIEGFEASAAALRRLDLWPVVRDIGARGDGKRFTFVAGEHDADIPEDSRRLAAAAGSEVVIVPDSGHIVNIQQPERFHRLVQEALRRA